MAKLSNYSVLKDSEWSCDYAEKQRQKIRSDYSLYFETTPVGHICLFAGGTLLRCEGYAEFTDSTGKKSNLYPQDNVLKIYRTYPDIQQTWNKVYGTNCFATGCPHAMRLTLVLGGQIASDDSLITQVRTTDWIDASIAEYRDTMLAYFQILELCVRETNFQFPNRLAPKIVILDAGSASGICPNHTTHNGYPPQAYDICYFTLTECNNTQSNKLPKAKIWNEPDWTPNSTLNLSVFDVERNAHFAYRLLKCHPNLQLIMAEKIKFALMSKYQKGTDQYKVLSGIQGCADYGLNHWMHAHVYAREINRCYVFD